MIKESTHVCPFANRYCTNQCALAVETGRITSNYPNVWVCAFSAMAQNDKPYRGAQVVEECGDDE